MNLIDKSWTEIGEIKTDRVIIPVGSIEQHGPHLPLGTDTLIAEAVSKKISEKTNAVVAPTISIGISDEHMDFRGTMTLSKETFKSVIKDICKSLAQHGFKEKYIINGHGGNRKALRELVSEEKNVHFLDIINKIEKYDHAGEIETSLMLYLYPEKVRVKKITEFKYEFPKKRGWRMIEHSKSGVLGDANKATKEKGEKYFEQIIEGILDEIKNEQH